MVAHQVALRRGVAPGCCATDRSEFEIDKNSHAAVVHRARLFYQALGCGLIGQSDGSRNEENERDCTYSYGPVALPSDIRHPTSW